MSARIVSPDFCEDMVGTLSLLARQHYDLVIVDFVSAQGAACAQRCAQPHVRPRQVRKDAVGGAAVRQATNA
jgi:hypothetical protein